MWVKCKDEKSGHLRYYNMGSAVAFAAVEYGEGWAVALSSASGNLNPKEIGLPILYANKDRSEVDNVLMRIERALRTNKTFVDLTVPEQL